MQVESVRDRLKAAAGRYLDGMTAYDSDSKFALGCSIIYDVEPERAIEALREVEQETIERDRGEVA